MEKKSWDKWQYRNCVTAIFFCNEPLHHGRNFGKYRNIKNNPPSIDRFERLLQTKFPTVIYVNYYNSYTREYLYRKYFHDVRSNRL